MTRPALMELLRVNGLRVEDEPDFGGMFGTRAMPTLSEQQA